MWVIFFLIFVISFVNSQDTLQIPNAADLSVLPGSVGNIGNSDQRYGPRSGFDTLGLVPLTNIGSGPVGNIGPGNNGQGGLGNLPLPSQNNGQSGIASVAMTLSQNNNQASIVNLPGKDSKDNGQGGDGNLPQTGSQNNDQSGNDNFPNTNSQSNGQGGVENLPQTGSQNNGQGGFSNLINNGQDSFRNSPFGNLPNLPNNGQGGFGNSPFGNLPNLPTDNGLGGFGNSSFGNLPNLQNDEEGIERPCQVFDIHCIRRYFKNNSKCKEVHGPVPEPYYRGQSSLQITRINATFSAFNVLYEGLNGRISEFYINRKTDRLVLSIEFRNVTFFSRDVYYRFYRRGREPITTYDYLYINYKSYITTTIIPKVRDLQLQKSETTTFTNDAIPAFSIGPNAFSYPDSTVQLARVVLLASIPVVVREAQLTEGPFTAATFIQNSICDFKLNVL